MVVAAAGTHKSQDKVWAATGWARLQHPPAIAETVGGPCQAGLKHPPAHTRSGAGNEPDRRTLGTMLDCSSHW